VFDAVVGQFGGVCGCKDNITLNLGVDDLADLTQELVVDGSTTVVFVKRTTRRYFGVA
jgi:hypothetical protein